MKITKAAIKFAHDKAKDAISLGTHVYTITKCAYILKRGRVFDYQIEENTACHAGITYHPRGWGWLKPKSPTKLLFMLDRIINYGKHTDSDVAFLQYCMDHPIIGQSFVERDAKKALKDGYMLRDLSKLPSNVMMFCLILTRALWEDYQRALPSRWYSLITHGFSEDEALVLATIVKYYNGRFVYSPMQESGHNAIPCNSMSKEYLINFVNHKIVKSTGKTVLMGGVTNDGEACVYSTFDQHSLDIWNFAKSNGVETLRDFISKNIETLRDEVTKIIGDKHEN